MRLLPLTHYAPIFAPLVGRRVALIDGIGGTGDKLIYRATRQLLDAFGIQWRACEPQEIADVDVVLLFGGGNLDSYYDGEVHRRRVACERAEAIGAKTIVLPQYSMGMHEGRHFDRLFVRDLSSLKTRPEAVLAPDLALGFDHAPPSQPPRHSLGLFLREDRESLLPHDIAYVGDPYHMTHDLDELFRIAADYAHIVTDRLHFGICGLLSGRRVTLLPVNNHKSREMWELWLRHVGCEWSDEVPAFVREQPIASNYLLAWSADPEVRAYSTSGGFTKELMRHALASGYVDKLVFPKMNGTRAEFMVTDDASELMSPATNSIYQPISPLKGLSRVPDGETCAITLLPCHVEALRENPRLQQKAKLVIELACGHTPHYAWTEECLAKLGVDEEEVAQLDYRNGLWPGDMVAHLRNGEEARTPFPPLWNPDPTACSPAICGVCTRMGGLGDVLVADPWRLEETYQKDSPGKTMVQVLNPAVWDLIQTANIEYESINRGQWDHSMTWLRTSKQACAVRA
ncbi:Coenzyme F420 hydrogenase/dehydrogenase, beta subunit C-terminal domain [Blastopirellula marina]|uniref:Polysaccharide pyruvyl transferase domain-containing protein n=1 Tax=Blastopirellula marina TaxID=124 RepID=A0A2S8GH71_9BACT|nr:Coenzyme F420 hydrogenase/dehydrogenase, beta subunit C-terminal domain [Blastopirellula marina]PQO43812.1 hypothetical protein C5Y93_21740 [Blastopirellula marina]